MKTMVVPMGCIVACLHGLFPFPVFGELGPFPSQNPVQGSSPPHSLMYVSDYFSFVGQDTQGRVAFALDTNRGRDGDQWQAEHFVVLHDERAGWVAVEGNGPYDNVHRDLLSIPDSPTFHFEGSPADGIVVRSGPNALALHVNPILRRVARHHENGEFWLGSGEATLEWKGRVLEGRVIYEYLSKPDFNRLTRTYWGLWDNFQGFYLAIDGIGDLYLHQSEGEMLAALTGKQEAFAVLHDRGSALAGLSLSTLDRTVAPGLYRWPVRWELGWIGEAGQATVRLETVDFTRIANWIIGGFAMSIVQGEIQYEGKSYPVYGFAELLM